MYLFKTYVRTPIIM